MVPHAGGRTRWNTRAADGRPEFFSFEDTRKNHDLDATAREYLNEGARVVDQALRAEYTKRNRLWRVFYPRYDQFKSQYDACVNRILREEIHGPDARDDVPTSPTSTPPPPAYTPEPSDETKRQVLVRDNHRCLCCGNDNRRRALQVDHIVPKYLRVDHRIENLQTLCGTCNRDKGDTEIIDFRNHRTTLTAAPEGFPDTRRPSGRNAKDPGQWDMYLRRCVNFHYRCAATERVDLAARGERLRIWRLWLFQGNPPAWLEPHLPALAARIRQARAEAGFQPAPEEIVIAG